MRRRAGELDLDTSHFSGNRRWSHAQLEQAIQLSSSWPEVAERLGLIRERRTGLRLKGDALRLGFDVSHLEDVHPHQRDDRYRVPPQLSELRRAAPSLAAAWFTLRGFAVTFPIEPQEYDLLVTGPRQVMRVQVKSTTSLTSNGKWQVGIGQRPHSVTKTGARAPYDPESIDLFAVINGVGDLYLIPMQVVAGLTGIYLSAYGDYKVGDVSSLLADSC